MYPEYSVIGIPLNLSLVIELTFTPPGFPPIQSLAEQDQNVICKQGWRVHVDLLAQLEQREFDSKHAFTFDGKIVKHEKDSV